MDGTAIFIGDGHVAGLIVRLMIHMFLRKRLAGVLRLTLALSQASRAVTGSSDWQLDLCLALAQALTVSPGKSTVMLGEPRALMQWRASNSRWSGWFCKKS